MSQNGKDERPLLSIPEQKVRNAMREVLAKNGGKVPSLPEVQKELKRQGVRRSIPRISSILTSLEAKGYVRYSVEVLA